MAKKLTLKPLELFVVEKKVKKHLEKIKIKGVHPDKVSLSFSDWWNIIFAGIGEYFKERSRLTDLEQKGNIIIEILKVILKILTGKL